MIWSIWASIFLLHQTFTCVCPFCSAAPPLCSSFSTVKPLLPFQLSSFTSLLPLCLLCSPTVSALQPKNNSLTNSVFTSSHFLGAAMPAYGERALQNGNAAVHLFFSFFFFLAIATSFPLNCNISAYSSVLPFSAVSPSTPSSAVQVILSFLCG